MEKFEIVVVGKENFDSFSPYLLPRVRRDLQAGSPILAVGAIYGEYAIGAAAAVVEEGEMKLLSLFVDKDTRRCGVGRELLRGLADVFSEMGISVETASANYMLEEENHLAVSAFLQRMGFETAITSSRIFSVDSAKLHETTVLGSALSTKYQADPHVRPFSALTKKQMEEIEGEENAPSFLKPSAIQSRILRQASMAWVEDGRILGWLIASQSFDGEIILSAAYRREEAPGDCFLKLLRAFANRCYLTLGRDYLVYVCAISEEVSRLVERIARGTQQEYTNYEASTGGEIPFWM